MLYLNVDDKDDENDVGSEPVNEWPSFIIGIMQIALFLKNCFW